MKQEHLKWNKQNISHTTKMKIMIDMRIIHSTIISYGFLYFSITDSEKQ